MKRRSERCGPSTANRRATPSAGAAGIHRICRRLVPPRHGFPGARDGMSSTRRPLHQPRVLTRLRQGSSGSQATRKPRAAALGDRLEKLLHDHPRRCGQRHDLALGRPAGRPSVVEVRGLPTPRWSWPTRRGSILALGAPGTASTGAPGDARRRSLRAVQNAGPGPPGGRPERRPVQPLAAARNAELLTERGPVRRARGPRRWSRVKRRRRAERDRVVSSPRSRGSRTSARPARAPSSRYSPGRVGPPSPPGKNHRAHVAHALDLGARSERAAPRG